MTEKNDAEVPSLSLALEHSLCGFNIIDQNGMFIYVNKEYMRLWGYSDASEIIGTSPASHCADPDIPREIIAQLKENGQHRIEFMARRKDGTTFDALMMACLYRDPNGREYYSGSSFDISQMREYEAQLQHLNRVHRLRSAINAAISHLDDLREMLDQACRDAVDHGDFPLAWLTVDLPDHDPGQLTAHHAKIAIPPDFSAALLKCALTQKALADGEPLDIDDVLEEPQLSFMHEYAREAGCKAAMILPLNTSDGVVGVFTLYANERGFFDIKERKLTEQVAADLSFAIELAQRETERRQLQEQFLQAQKLDSIGQLAGGVAHDFNNVLAVILMQSELVLNKTDVQDVREGLKEIQDAARRASDLTRQLLTFSRRQVFQKQTVDLNRRVSGILRMLKRIVGEDIQIQLDLTRHPLLIDADPQMMEQIVMNLVVNARDAMPQGGTIRIRSELLAADATDAEDQKPSETARLTFEDTGIGIAKENLDRIFEPFFSTKAASGGTGLGLSTVFGIVKQHGGTLRVDSQPGCTRFQVDLPVCGADAEEISDTQSEESAPQPGTEKILLVEDDRKVRDSAQAILRSAGYSVRSLSRATSALELSEESFDYDLLLTDIVMPGGVSGIELAEKMRSRHPDLCIILSTGYSAELAGKAVDPDACSRFLAKPYTANELLCAVRQTLDGL